MKATTEECKIAADACEEMGLGGAAEVLRSKWTEWIGQRIAVYGPRYIWRGQLVRVDGESITLADVYEVDETGSHEEAACQSEQKISDEQIFLKTAICNAGPTLWA